MQGARQGGTIGKPRGLKPHQGMAIQQRKSSLAIGLMPGEIMYANAFPRNAIAKPALRSGDNRYGYGNTRAANIRAAVTQAKEAGVAVKISRRRGSNAVAYYSAADNAITINARSPAWADQKARAIKNRRSGFGSSAKPEHLMAHEIGHAKSRTLTAGTDWRIVASNANVKLSPGWDEMRPVRSIANRVSAYAREHPQEFVAEYKSARAGGRRFDPEVVRLYRAAAGLPAPKARRRRR